MLVDHRTYTVKPGTMAKHLAIYQEFGLTPQKRHLGEPLAYLITESGEVNTYIRAIAFGISLTNELALADADAMDSTSGRRQLPKEARIGPVCRLL